MNVRRSILPFLLAAVPLSMPGLAQKPAAATQQEAKDKAAADAARDKEMAAKGLVQVDGVWVEKGHVDEARRGIFHHGDELVSKADKLALLAGKVRHPETGGWIDAKDLEQAKAGKFPLGGGKWGDEKEADAYHEQQPWVVRSTFCTLVTRMPLAKVRELTAQLDQAWTRVAPLFGNQRPSPAHRPVVIVAATQDEYVGYGRRVGDESSSNSAFLANEGAKFSLEGLDNARAGIADGTGALGVYSARHAAGLAYAAALAADATVQLPNWFLHGVGSLTSRFHLPSDAAHYAKQDLQSGGVTDLRSFFRGGFKLGNDDTRRHLLFQAGLVLDFASKTDDAAVKGALNDLKACFAPGHSGDGSKEVAALEDALIAAQTKVEAHLKSLAN